jgi:hypothetical protein
MNLPDSIAAVLCKAKEGKNYSELETLVPYAILQQTIHQLLEAHNRAVQRAADRKEPRRWTPAQDEVLRLAVQERRSIGEMAEQVERTPLAVKNRLIVLGLLRIANIRPSSSAPPGGSVPAKTTLEPVERRVDAKADESPETSLRSCSCDSNEDELCDRSVDELARQQAEAERAKEEELQTQLEEWEAAAEVRAAKEQSTFDGLKDKAAA